MNIKGICNAIVDTKNRWIISFIVGLGVSLFVMNKCMYGRCVVIQGPPRERIVDRIFQVGDSCVTFHPEPAACEHEDDPIDSIDS
jgi:diphthamide synthase subunit DPH2